MEDTEEVGLIAHKVRVHLNNKQASWMRQNCIACRLAYNFGVAKLRDSKKDDGNEFPSAYSVSKQWTQERDTLHPWMREQGLNMDTISGVFARNYGAALNQWKLAGWSADKAPKFHGRGSTLSSTWRGRMFKQIDAQRFALPGKRGTFRLGCPLRFDGEIRSVTFSESGGKWYASFLVKTAIPKPKPAPQGTAVGVDVGVVQFASLSTGEQFAPAMNHNVELEKLAKLQREQARMQGPVKGQRRASRNWLKQQRKVQKQHRRIANVRRHYTEVVSKDIASRFETIAIEDLKVKNMTASAKGEQESPGKNVKAKAGLNRSILNGGFYLFRSRLEAKASARNGRVIPVNPAYTSQTCPACGHIDRANRPDQATFACVSCGHSSNADLIAAQNILHRGLTDIAS